MLVICEECGKKYSIDVSRIKGTQAKFRCQQCSHIITVEKPDPETRSSSIDDSTREIPIGNESDINTEEGLEAEDLQQDGTVIGDTVAKEEGSEAIMTEGSGDVDESRTSTPAKKPGKGMPVAFYLFIAMVAGFLATIGAVTYPYFTYIPHIISQQVGLRMETMATSFAGAVSQPMLKRDYLQVNKETEQIISHPGVAYAAVVNDRGVVIAGLFRNLNEFTPDFGATVKAKGFPQSIISQHHLDKKMNKDEKTLAIGGRKIIDKVIRVQDAGGEVHIGNFPYNMSADIKKALLTPTSMMLIGVILFCGFLLFMILVRAISVPLKELTDIVDRISLGELDLSIKPKGPREIRNLALAFERMRYSFTVVANRLKKLS